MQVASYMAGRRNRLGSRRCNTLSRGNDMWAKMLCSAEFDAVARTLWKRVLNLPKRIEIQLVTGITSPSRSHGHEWFELDAN
jgi:hypothetical protein